MLSLCGEALDRQAWKSEATPREHGGMGTSTLHGVHDAVRSYRGRPSPLVAPSHGAAQWTRRVCNNEAQVKRRHWSPAKQVDGSDHAVCETGPDAVQARTGKTM